MTHGAPEGDRPGMRTGFSAWRRHGVRRPPWPVLALGFLLCLAPLVAPLTGGNAACTSAELAGLSVRDAVQPTAEDAAELDRIFQLVKKYRRSADEAWQRELAEAIHAEAAEAGLDPLFVAAIVATESSFQSRVVSPAGAVGLMQMRPFVAEAVAARHEVDWHGPDVLHDPKLNVRLGVRYYLELLDRFDGDARTALTAYNFGPTRVRRQLLAESYRHSRYAENVLGLYDRLVEKRARLEGAVVLGLNAAS